ncbi:MAG: hypothetical protein ACRDK2_06785 [Solirubrobacteraceae bacterium]
MTATGCGSSNSTTSTQAAASASTITGSATATSTTPSNSPGQPAHTPTVLERYAACLAQNGVKLNKVNGVPSLGGINTHSPQYQAASKKCQSGIERAQKLNGTARIKSSASDSNFSKYLACLRQNGVSVPSSDMSGTPSLKGIDTASSQYREAATKCRKTLFGNRAASTSKTSTAVASARLHSLLVRYIACLRQNGVNVPSSDTNGVGSLKGVNTTTPQFKAARTKCESVILSALKTKSTGPAPSGH